jgi:hypothetical protein
MATLMSDLLQYKNFQNPKCQLSSYPGSPVRVHKKTFSIMEKYFSVLENIFRAHF